MDWYATAKMYFDMGLWTKQDLGVLVQKGKITAAQYEMITGEPFTEQQG